MDWQLGIVLGAVAGAVLYLGRAAWRSWRGAKQGCGGGCGCGVKAGGSGQIPDRPPLIPVEQIRLRRR
jgi:FeoB-associated Cys-rich membrane protein